MSSPRMKSFNYAIGMFGTSIPINMLKTYAAIYYVDGLGMTTVQFSLMLLIYSFRLPGIGHPRGIPRGGRLPRLVLLEYPHPEFPGSKSHTPLGHHG